MKKGVRIVNCARGGIVDEDALADAVESKHVAGAALDVFVNEPIDPNHRLLKLPGVVTTPHLGASTEEAQELVALEAAEIIAGFLTRGEVRHAVNIAPISATEMNELKAYLDLGRRLGLLLAQMNRGSRVKAANLVFRGDAATKNTKLVANAFAAGLLEAALEDNVNIVNADMMAKERGIRIVESTSSETGDFSTLIKATVETEQGELTAAGTIFGKQFLRLVRLGPYSLDAYLDGLLLVYRHRDVPGLIGFIGTVFGRHNVNIAHMALGRERNEPGGNAVAVLNLDTEPTAAALAELKQKPEVQSVELVKLPPAGAPLPWLFSKP
jgi:D-3-phosphoglycerate dehydrogenase